MSLKNKVIVILLSVFAAYGAVEYTVQRKVLLPSFIELERDAATSNAERTTEALQREAELLLPSARDWALWDNTYEFVATPSQDYIDANLGATSLQGVGVNIVAIYDTLGRSMWAEGYDLDTAEALDLGELAYESLDPAHPLLANLGNEDPVTGLFQTASGIFVIGTAPILRSDGTGPSRGRLLMGRLLDDDAIVRLAEQARVQLSVTPAPPIDSGPIRDIDRENAIAHTPIEQEETGELTIGHFTVLDVGGRPLLRFEVATPRTIVAQGKRTLRYATLSLLGAGTAVLLLLLALLRRTVFDPVGQLTQHAIELGHRDDLSARIGLDRKDEIGVLAREFDHMVERLAEARRRLLEQSFKSGLAEMASGVLHNVGNAVTPIGVKLTSLQQDLSEIPTAELEMAAAELADPTTPAERRAALTRFLEVATPVVVSSVRRTAHGLESAHHQIQHVVAILADQHHFSRAERVLEPLRMLPILEETIRLLPEQISAGITIEMDPEIGRIGQVRASRVAVQQVLTNILINAAEAIRERGSSSGSGQVRIRVVSPADGESSQVHLCFEDDGVGIPQENLVRIFESGFSTKARGSGMGLHWSANTVSALGGRIYAESAGVDSGTRVHLLLPLAVGQPRMDAAA